MQLRACRIYPVRRDTGGGNQVERTYFGLHRGLSLLCLLVSFAVLTVILCLFLLLSSLSFCACRSVFSTVLCLVGCGSNWIFDHVLCLCIFSYNSPSAPIFFIRLSCSLLSLNTTLFVRYKIKLCLTASTPWLPLVVTSRTRGMTPYSIWVRTLSSLTTSPLGPS